MAFCSIDEQELLDYIQTPQHHKDVLTVRRRYACLIPPRLLSHTIYIRLSNTL
jgi:hypothetical protein